MVAAQPVTYKIQGGVSQAFLVKAITRREINHDRAFSRARVGETEVELTLETSGREQIETIKRHLAHAGYAVEEVTRGTGISQQQPRSAA